MGAGLKIGTKMTKILPHNQPSDTTGFFKRPPNPKPLIMVVGPNADTRYMLRVILEIWDYDVVEAETPDDSITLGSSRHPSLILLDTTMHFTDTLADIRLLQQEDGLSDVPSVLISGFSQNIYRETALKNGASGFLVKPIDFDLLHEYIETLADGNNPGTNTGTLL
jgi:CheY-like chemotaxis protein